MTVIFVTRFSLPFLTVWEGVSVYNTDHEMKIVNILLRMLLLLQVLVKQGIEL